MGWELGGCWVLQCTWEMPVNDITAYGAFYQIQACGGHSTAGMASQTTITASRRPVPFYESAI